MSQAGQLGNEDINPRLPFQILADGGTYANFILNQIHLIGGAGTTVLGDDNNTLTVSVTAAAFNWNVVTSSTNPNSIVSENGYIPKGVTAVTFLLPTTAAVGDAFRIAGYGNLWTLTQNSGQSIILGVLTTTVGTGGSLTATQVSDSIELICVTANTGFKVLNSIGNLTIV